MGEVEHPLVVRWISVASECRVAGFESAEYLPILPDIARVETGALLDWTGPSPRLGARRKVASHDVMVLRFSANTYCEALERGYNDL
jgi:hypothetical protein